MNYAIKDGKNTVGSDPGCDIVLNYPKIVDEKHVCIEVDDDEISIVDLNSSKGLWKVNDEGVKTKKKAGLNAIDNLSNREFEIAKLLISGEGNLEISNKLNIQMSTVSTYKNRIFEKLNINNVVSLSELFKIKSLDIPKAF